jgi:hypothetical protein
MFKVFGAVALAGIGRLPDTLEDRGVLVTMRRKGPSEALGDTFDRRPHFRILTPTGLALGYLVADAPAESDVAAGWQWSRRGSRSGVADRLVAWSARPIEERADAT